MKANKPSFILTPNAKITMREIGRYTQKQWGRAQRVKYLAMIDRRFVALAEDPAMGRQRTDIGRNVRSYSEGRHVIFYRVEKRGIVILDILHDAMDPSIHITIH